MDNPDFVMIKVMNEGKKILLSGVKPTGRPHIGNYFGAMKQFVDLQDNYNCFFMLADYHAITKEQNSAELRQDTLDLAIDYLAIGLDPGKVTLFKQSSVSAHTELTWIFNCLTTMPYLMRAHAFKDAEAKNHEVSVGLFDYPLLMSADILLYDVDVVPVGADQKQHIEIARDTAEKFNRVYGEAFKLPEPLIMPDVAVVPGLDGEKMSKSYKNTIPLFVNETELKQLVMSIKTDSKTPEEPKNPEECNVFALHKLVSGADFPELKKRYVEGGIGYKESKEILFKNLNAFLAPMRERREEIAKDTDKIRKILELGGEKAKQVADKKMNKVRELVGVN